MINTLFSSTPSINDVELAKEAFNKDNSKNSVWKDLEIYNKEVPTIDSDMLVVIGIGGSYLGIVAALNFLNINSKKIIFLGNNLDFEDIEEKLQKIKGSISINVISKSGNTLETIVSLNILLEYLKNNNIDCRKKILTTSFEESYLSRNYDFEIFHMNENLIGRYSSIFVSLITFKFLGINIEEIKRGMNYSLKSNEPFKYAAFRNLEYKNNKKIEIFQYYEKNIELFSNWWVQLFGESEGKQKKGIFPTTLMFSRDLHSMGQYIQEGNESFFQTTLKVNKGKDISLNNFRDNLENLNNVSLRDLNRMVFSSSLYSHSKVSNNCVIEIEKKDEFYFGALIFFFHKACIASATLLGVNPYDNEGVKIYKDALSKEISDIKKKLK